MPEAHAENLTHKFLSRYYRATKFLGELIDTAAKEHLEHGSRDFMVINTILKGQVYPSQIGKHLHASKFAVSRILQKLEDRGFVERKIDKNDSRRVQLAVTEEGMQARERALSSMEQGLQPVLEAVGGDRIRTLLDILDVVIAQRKEQ